MQTVKISTVKSNPDNPRLIKDDKFKKLVTSLKEFPEMAAVRPIVVNGDMVVLGGNMRLKAMQEAGWKDVPIEVVDWSEEKQREFIIKDNVSFGEWDWSLIANEWDAEQVAEWWGLDVWQPDDFSDKNKEIDIDELGDDMVIKLTYSEDEYNQVKEALSKIAATPEQAVWSLLKL